jgi:type IV pilus biogenesis protein CpaD/CtpE
MFAHLKKSSVLVLAGCAALALGACSMETDTSLAMKRVRLEYGPTYDAKALSAMTGPALHQLADDYTRTGQGPLELTVSYDPRSATNTAMNAATEAARLAGELHYMGVKDVKTGVLPVNGLGNEAQVLVRYEAVNAAAPEGCEYMGGFDGKQTAADENYGYGCSVEMFLARQIARPGDLAGRGGMDAADGRRQGALTEEYRTNTAPPPLSGYSTTDN